MKILYGDMFKDKNFTLLLFGRFFKRSALVLFSLELIWLTMELTHSSPIHLSFMVMAETLPFILLGIYGGVIADKLNKKRLMVISDILTGMLILLIPILYYLNSINYLILMGIAVLISIFNCFSEPSFRAILPELVKDSKLQKGNALLDSIQRGASIIIPASVGIIVKLTDQIHILTLAFILISIASICHFLIYYNTNIENMAKVNNKTMVEIKMTLSYLKINKDIFYVILVQAISIFINTGLWRVGLPIYLESRLGEDIGTFGLITGILGASSFGTSILIGLAKKLNPISIFNMGIILWGAGLLITSFSPTVYALFVAAAIIGIGQALEGLGRVVIIQNEVPKEMLGKVFSISSSINYTSDTVSLGIISAVLSIFSPSIIFFSGGTLIILTGILGMRLLKERSKEIGKNLKKSVI
ncbi:MFS transporter [Bacillus sp. PS06]|uniref:MFS transporter n=1 Tax=Bacillus sp. PS06 TaxID=2764176 RepID=UPI00178393B1|nr:MFS transporter [Bacillus sp. PS06]MBD8071085.1 MFS transporter [Bacillus sp. PS06]